MEDEAGYSGWLRECCESSVKCTCERCCCDPSMHWAMEVVVSLHKVSVTISPKIYCEILDTFPQKLKLEKM